MNSLRQKSKLEITFHGMFITDASPPILFLLFYVSSDKMFFFLTDTPQIDRKLKFI